MRSYLLSLFAIIVAGCCTPIIKAPEISLHEAAKEGNIEAVRQHLAAGVDVNLRDEKYNTPLHYVTTDLQLDIAELLIKHGAEVNAENSNRKMPIHMASPSSSAELAKLLIEKGAFLKGNVQLPDKEASTGSASGRIPPLRHPFGKDENNMELRGGLWYVKGEAKPFSGRLTLWTPGHGNEIGRLVVKTYVNGKEQGSKVFRIIGKQAPRPNR